ncbi:PqiC family protein [Paraburkholderia sp. HD33-4]|uniref:PqiC family protein n=1 Tax=Paraburkholderia sp. HD33-4 TaxID=2883242 RepID=UPI001F34F9BE|nr:PqiC family protein [Paraburkholderia sp. HD33-4]
MNRLISLFLSIIVAGCLAACTSPPASKFYTLSPIQITQAAPAADRIAIAFDPITLPEIVDRPQMVVRLDPNRVSIDEFARWAEPLKNQIPRVLAADLAQLIPGAITSTYPQHADDTAYRVTVDVQTFESSAEGTVMLAVLWSVRAPKQGHRVSGRSVVSRSGRGPGYHALVSAHDEALESVACDIAVATYSMMHQ